MDPDEALARLRRMVEEDLTDRAWSADTAAADDRCQTYAVQFQAVDNWLTNGGFLPADWRKGSTRPVDMSAYTAQEGATDE